MPIFGIAPIRRFVGSLTFIPSTLTILPPE
jgi:hypothetical protein